MFTHFMRVFINFSETTQILFIPLHTYIKSSKWDSTSGPKILICLEKYESMRSEQVLSGNFTWIFLMHAPRFISEHEFCVRDKKSQGSIDICVTCKNCRRHLLISLMGVCWGVCVLKFVYTFFYNNFAAQ